MDERRYREVEKQLWDSLELSPIERFVGLASTATSVRIQEVGVGPPVLLIHGGAVSGSSWAPLAAQLSGYRLLMLDRPGCGLSQASGQNFASIDEFVASTADLVPSVLDALRLDRAHVVATSLGGLFAFQGAAAFPERIDRLVGIGSIFGSAMDSIPLIMRLGSLGPMPKIMVRMPPSRQAVRAMLRQIGLKDAMKAGRVTRTFEDWFLANLKHTDTMINETLGVPPIINMGGIAPQAIMSTELLAKVTAPCKLIWGEADPMAGPSVAREFTAQLANAELELWPSTGHAPWIDDPARAGASISTFLG